MSPEKPIRERKDSTYRSSRKSDVTSSYGTRSKTSCNDSGLGSKNTEFDKDEPDDHTLFHYPTTPSKTSGRARGGRNAGSSRARGDRNAGAAGTSGGTNAGASHRSASENQSMQFCSHKCLLGLKCGFRMDTQCANYNIHPKRSGGGPAGMHSIDLKSLQDLLRDQLAETMDINCTPMRKQGARGAMFKLTLASHGYTIVGKGTVKAFVPDLWLENQFYDLLRPVQGSIVPVCMGSIDCVYPYYYHFATKIVHFLLLSWAGEALTPNSESCWESHADQIFRMNDQLRILGVAHGDIWPENVLWNEALGQLMLIDFERSTLIPPLKANKAKLPSSSLSLAVKSKVSASSIYADNMRRFELCSSPTKKRNRSSSVDDTSNRQRYGTDMGMVRSARLQMV